MLSWTLHANFHIDIIKQQSSMNSLKPHSSHLFVHLCRIQTNWKSLRSKTVSLDQGNEIVHYYKVLTLMWQRQFSQSCLFILVYVARERWLLQTYFLWH